MRQIRSKTVWWIHYLFSPEDSRLSPRLSTMGNPRVYSREGILPGAIKTLFWVIVSLAASSLIARL